MSDSIQESSQHNVSPQTLEERQLQALELTNFIAPSPIPAPDPEASTTSQLQLNHLGQSAIGDQVAIDISDHHHGNNNDGRDDDPNTPSSSIAPGPKPTLPNRPDIMFSNDAAEADVEKSGEAGQQQIDKSTSPNSDSDDDDTVLDEEETRFHTILPPYETIATWQVPFYYAIYGFEAVGLWVSSILGLDTGDYQYVLDAAERREEIARARETDQQQEPNN